MRRRCAVSAFLAREEGAGAAEASAAGTAFLARGLRAFFTVSSAVIEHERVCTDNWTNATVAFLGVYRKLIAKSYRGDLSARPPGSDVPHLRCLYHKGRISFAV